jgi:hypothetical protein
VKGFLFLLIIPFHFSCLAQMSEADFYGQLCGFRQTFAIEQLYENDIQDKIIRGNNTLCREYNLDPSSVTGDAQDMPDALKDDHFSRAFAEVLRINKNNSGVVPLRTNGEKDYRAHLTSLLIGLTVSKVWPSLSLEDRVALRTHRDCEGSSTYGKLPRFSDLSVNVGDGSPAVVTELKALCSLSHNFYRLLDRLPRSLILEAFMILGASGLDLKPYIENYCSSSTDSFALVQGSMLEKIGQSYSQSGYLDGLNEIRESFGLNSVLLSEREFLSITDQNLSQEDQDALSAWKGRGYIWVSNREEFGVIGDLFSLFHEKGGTFRRPENLGRNISNLNILLDRLPAHQGLVFRGITIKNPEKEFRVDEEFSFSRLSSTSTKIGTAQSFSRQTETGEKSVVLVLNSQSGRNIMGFGPNSNEMEILFPPGVTFVVESVEERAGTYYVYAVEN